MKHGFTVFELVITVGISLLLLGLTIGRYHNFDQRQRLQQAALTLKENLRYAQTKSIAAEKPESGCSSLRGYRVRFSVTGYNLVASCTEGLVGTPISTTFPGGVSFNPVPAEFTFNVLTKTVNTASPISLVLTNGSQSYQLVVYAGGDISDNGFQ